MIGPKEGYVDLLDAATLNEATRPQERKYYPLRPSSAGKCTRELAYELAEFHGLAQYPKEPNSPELTRLFDLGHHVERHIVQQFERKLPRFELKYKQQVLSFFRVEAANHPEWSRLIEGSLDACFFSEDTRGVIDFKSKKDRFSAFHKTSWDDTTEKLTRMATVERASDKLFLVNDLRPFLAELKDAFFEQNFWQLNGYACSDFLRTRGIDHGAIIQYNKNDSRMREVRFKPCLDLFEDTRRKFQAALDAVDGGNPETAARDHVLGSVKCAYCPFRATCWEGKDALKAFYKSLPEKQWPRDTNYMGAAGNDIEALFASRALAGGLKDTVASVEDAILKLLMAKNVTKVRLANKEVYEVRKLKDSIVLRRSKA